MRHFVNEDFNFILIIGIVFECTFDYINFVFDINDIMLENKPKSRLKRILGISAVTVFAVEAVGIAVTYGLWFKLNTERDFRLYMYKNCNWVLDGYYKLGESLGGHKTRELDNQVWTNEGKI